MLKLAVLVSGGGTNLQAIIDAISAGKITNACISVVISNNANAYALERARAHGIEALCISPKDFESREAFNQAFLDKLNSYNVDLVVLAGFLVVLPEMMIKEYTNRIVNIHPSLIPSFCGKGFYGLKVHEGVLARGVKVTGATVHFVDDATDTGPIILQKAVEVEQGDTPEVLQRRVMEQAEWVILPKAIDLIANGKVTVKDGKISAIDVTSASGETASYFSKAKGIIPKMISGQTTNVDVASGATYSSNGIITAVRNALSKAETGKSSTKKKKKKNKKNKKKNSGSNSNNNNNNIAAPAEGYEDGTYTGSAACSGEQFKEYSVTANVTIKNGKISAVEISSTAKGTNLKQFMSRDEIKNLPSLIVSKNGTSGVDAVSGATYSSHAIFNAVNDALSKAKKNSSSTEKKEETTTEKKEETTTEKKEETTTEKKEETTTEKKEETTTEKKEETTENPDEGKNYKNGTYKVSITCEPDEDEDFDPYTISMDITIKKDKITEISNITANTNSTNKAYTNDAKKGMVSKIIANGNADGVNTVAGATCSSKAIKDACQKAFNAAKK